MLIRNSETHYGQVARTLHWTSVTLLVLAVYTSTVLGDLEDGPERLAVIAEHVSYGLALLILMLARFYWRQVNHNPLLSYSIHNIQKRAAISVHWFVYAAVICQSAIGINQLVAGGGGLTFFGWDIIHSFGPPNSALAERLNDVHHALANTIYIALSIHICAALYHQVFGVLDDD